MLEYGPKQAFRINSKWRASGLLQWIVKIGQMTKKKSHRFLLIGRTIPMGDRRQEIVIIGYVGEMDEVILK